MECFVLIDKLREPTMTSKHTPPESKEVQKSNYKDSEPVQHIVNNDKDTPVVKSAQGSTVDTLIKDVTNREIDPCGQSLPTVNNLIVHSAREQCSTPKKSCSITKRKGCFKCEVCGRTYADHWHFLKHKAQHLLPENECIDVLIAKKRPYLCIKNQANTLKTKCSVCRQICGSLYDLTVHMRVHDNERPFEFECTVCGARFKTSTNLKHHKYVHISFDCDLCGQSLATPATLSSHMLAHKQLSQLKCRFCGAVFDRVSAMGRHFVLSKFGWCAGQLNQDCEESDAHTPTQIEKDKDSRYSKELNDQKKPAQSEDHYPSICGICGKSFITSRLLKNHFKRHPLDMPFHCNECGKGFSNSKELEKHIALHFAGKKFKCGVCSKSFCSFSKLKNHISEHPKDMPWHCTICRKGFTMLADLESHKSTHDIDSTQGKPYQEDIHCKQIKESKKFEDDKEIHDTIPDMPFECAICGMRYTKRSRLRKHVKSHPKDMPYHCSICGKGFTQEVTLVDHEGMHKLEQPFKCPHCHRSFAVKWNLKSHIKAHFKPIECKTCLSSFSTDSGLRRHMQFVCVVDHQCRRVRKPKQVGSCLCDLCGRLYVESSIQRHLRLHLKEEEHVCRVCGKRYRLRGLLHDHMLVHADSVSFICEICGKGYKCKNKFRLHSNHCAKWYQCDVCGKKVKTPSGLTKHMNAHLNIIQFFCHVCEKGFRERTHLRQHMIVHEKK